ncbi:MAG TPA: MbnP family protein [Cryomorphaceae bacterium]|nr:MbnP family protein [Cryomorphaceae bacterium]
MKRFFFILLIASLTISCDDDESNPDSKLFMTFDPRFGGDDLQMGENHTNIHGYPFNVSDIKFYVSNIRLHKTDGDYVQLSDIELIAMQDNRRSIEFVVQRGKYSGLSYDLGVPSAMNGTNDPDFSISQYPAGHPLSEVTSGGMYWQWASGYRFFSFDGRFDLEPNSDPFLPMSFAFHTGTDTLFREVGMFEKSINIDSGETLLFAFAVDVDSIFATVADTINLAEVTSFHGSEAQLETGMKLANNMAKSFVLK